jgi:hypothetical protein
MKTCTMHHDTKPKQRTYPKTFFHLLFCVVLSHRASGIQAPSSGLVVSSFACGSRHSQLLDGSRLLITETVAWASLMQTKEIRLRAQTQNIHLIFNCDERTISKINPLYLDELSRKAPNSWPPIVVVCDNDTRASGPQAVPFLK